MKGYLWDWKGKCVACRVTGDEHGHVVTKCTAADGQLAGSDVLQQRRRIRFEQYAACYRCHAPQEICDYWVEDGYQGWVKSEGGYCQWYGIITSVVFGVRTADAAVWEGWMERLAEQGVDGKQDEAVYRWLGRRKDEGGVTGSNIAFEFVWICDQLKDRLG